MNEWRVMGHVWVPWRDGWAARCEDRFTVSVRPSAGRFSSLVSVDYEHAEEDAVGILLPPSPTEREAMVRGLEWVDHHLETGGPTPDQVFAKLFAGSRTIFRRRLDVLDHVFCTLGSGYAWLDGAIVEKIVEDPEIVQFTVDAQTSALKRDLLALLPEALHDELRARFDEISRADADLPIGPLPDDGGPHSFYPIGKRCLLATVPPDVRQDWLAVAHETAMAVRDRSDDAAGDAVLTGRASASRALAATLVTSLETAHPQLRRSP